MDTNSPSTFHLHGGFSSFVRSNPKTDRFKVKGFHHVEFWCGDATNTSSRFSHGLGMPLVAKSDLTTGNLIHASYLLRSGKLNLLFTAPYSPSLVPASNNASASASAAIPTFDYDTHLSFVTSHGLAVRAVALEVEDARAAFDASLAAGAKTVAEPVLLEGGHVILAEVQLYGDVVIRYVSYVNDTIRSNGDGIIELPYCFLPKFSPMERDDGVDKGEGFGILKLDHVAGCVPKLASVIDYFMNMTGFHEFEEFVAEDMLGFTETAVQTVFVANNDEDVIFNLIEPVGGTKENCFAQIFLDHNEGPGVQHLALVTNDIFKTIREMKNISSSGGFKFMPPPNKDYYEGIKDWIGDLLTKEQIKECEELSISVDRDHEGAILQIFTTPVGDKPTLIIEIIERIGCMVKGEDGQEFQKGGCGGFGMGNVKRLIKSVEEYEKTLAH